MIQERNSVVWHKLNGLLRYLLVHSITQLLPAYVINEYPKSGGSWVGQMLSEAIGVPFPRNRLPMLRSIIFQGHMMHKWNMHNVLLVWRDGRDILISQYYHSLFENDRGNARLVAECRADLGFSDYHDIQRNLVPFMEYVYETKRHPRMSWADFAQNWGDCKRCVHVRYEDLRASPVEELSRIVEELTNNRPNYEFISEIVENYSFEKVSGRKIGEENHHSFLRKGVIGDWKNYFTPEASERFLSYAGDSLIKLGYEPDYSWSEEIKY